MCTLSKSFAASAETKMENRCKEPTWYFKKIYLKDFTICLCTSAIVNNFFFSEKSIFDDSLGTLTNYDSSSQPTETSFVASKTISTNLMDYICPCDEHELTDGLQHLKEQLQNISNEELFYRFFHSSSFIQKIKKCFTETYTMNYPKNSPT